MSSFEMYGPQKPHEQYQKMPTAAQFNAATEPVRHVIPAVTINMRLPTPTRKTMAALEEAGIDPETVYPKIMLDSYRDSL